MKNLILKYLALGFVALNSAVLVAQDKGLDIDIDLGGKEWYDNPVYVVVGVVVVLLILALIFKGRK